jgi:uncharacterized protein YxjI
MSHHHHHHHNQEFVEEIIYEEGHPNYRRPQVIEEFIYVQDPNQQQYGQQQQNYNQNQQYNQQQNQQYNQQQNQQYNQNQNQQNFQQQNYQQQNFQNQNQQNQQQQQQNYQQQNFQQQDPFYSQSRRVLQVQNEWFSFLHNVDIKDEQGNVAYKAEGKFFHLGLDMLLKDHQGGNTLCEIKSRVFSLMPEYDFYQNGQIIGKLRKEVHLFVEGWHFEDVKKGIKWQVSGDFLGYDWKIHTGQQQAGEISKRHSIFKDHYGVSIEPGQDLTQIICVAICMEKYHHDHHLVH